MGAKDGLGVTERVRFLGAVDQKTLRSLYSGIDALVLASSREGWANVLLEAMACGTPAIASPIWGNPEVVAKPEAGILMTERSPKGIADAVLALFGPRMPTREATRAYAQAFSWDATTQGQIDLFRRVIAEARTEV